MTDIPIPADSDLSDAEAEELMLLCGHAPGPEPLSPAAQAVMDAYMNEDRAGRLAVAAALRAAVLNAQPKAHIEDIDYVHQQYVDGWEDALGVIHAITGELEGQQ